MIVANFDPNIVKASNAVPTAYYWRDCGRVSPIKDQGSCDSCWVFPTVANFEGLIMLINL